MSLVPTDAVGNRGEALVRAVRHDVTGPVIAAVAIELTFGRVALSATDGTKTVVVCFKDAAGNVSIAQDTSVLDSTLPTGAIVVAAGAAKTRLTTNVAVTVSSIDSDLASMAIIDATSGSPQTCANASYVAFSTSGTLAAFANATNQTKTVGLCLRDRAGNQTSAPAGTDTITLDTILVATGVTVSLQGQRKDGIVNGDLTRVTSTTIVVSGAATDVVGIEIANDATFFGSFNDVFRNGVVYPFTLDLGDGVKDVFVRLTDDAGNTVTLSNGSPVGTDLSINLDTTPPSAPLIVLNGGTPSSTRWRCRSR